LVWPEPKEADARWPTYISTWLHDDLLLGVEGAWVHAQWLDADLEVCGDDFDLVDVGDVVYQTSTTEAEPPAEAVWCRVTILESPGWQPDVPQAITQTKVLTWLSENPFEWQMQEE